MTEKIALRPFTRDEFDAASAIMEMAFLSPGRQDERDEFATGLEFERTLGAYAGPRIVGTAGIYSFELTVPGASTPAAGVTIVTVHPSFRRRGILSSIMDRQLGELHEGGEPIAVLRASEASIYGRFGYAAATRELYHRLDRAAARLVAPPGPDGEPEVELAEPGQVREQLAAVYDAARAAIPGFIGRNATAWDNELHDAEHRREGATALRAALVGDRSSTVGYALYRVKENWTDGLPNGRVRVKELVATDPQAATALWRHVLNIDLTTTVEINTRPLDDPLLRMLTNARQARAGQFDGLWLRLVRLGDAMAARRYAAPVDLVLEITDARCPWNARRWRLSGDETGASCSPTTDPADLQVDSTALAAAYLGDAVLGGYAAAGRITEHRTGRLRRLAAALGWAPAPWCPHHF